MSGMNSKAGSSEDLMSMAKLNIATDKFHLILWYLLDQRLKNKFLGALLAFWFLTSKVEISKSIRILCDSLSFHGRLLIEGAEIALNYGQRYGLLGENGSGKVCDLGFPFIPFLISLS
jgi:ATP-binding cassette, subfamily F, member 2